MQLAASLAVDGMEPRDWRWWVEEWRWRVEEKRQAARKRRMEREGASEWMITPARGERGDPSWKEAAAAAKQRNRRFRRRRGETGGEPDN
jgi:hypothetical protein